MPSESILVVANGKFSFSFVAEQYSILFTYHVFIHSSVDGHLRCFPILTTVNNVAMNIGVHVIFFGYTHVPIYTPTNSVQLFPFLQKSSLTFVICVLFDDSHSDRSEVISYCGFNLHFTDDL